MLLHALFYCLFAQCQEAGDNSPVFVALENALGFQTIGSSSARQAYDWAPSLQCMCWFHTSVLCGIWNTHTLKQLAHLSRRYHTCRNVLTQLSNIWTSVTWGANEMHHQTYKISRITHFILNYFPTLTSKIGIQKRKHERHLKKIFVLLDPLVDLPENL